MTAWSSEVRMRSAMMRAITSAGPPAPVDTTTVIGRDGKACALAIRETAGKAAAPAVSEEIDGAEVSS